VANYEGLDGHVEAELVAVLEGSRPPPSTARSGPLCQRVMLGDVGIGEAVETSPEPPQDATLAQAPDGHSGDRVRGKVAQTKYAPALSEGGHLRLEERGRHVTKRR
jgi:hypothetical protein